MFKSTFYLKGTWNVLTGDKAEVVLKTGRGKKSQCGKLRSLHFTEDQSVQEDAGTYVSPHFLYGASSP